MKLLRRVVLATLLVLIVAAAWVWWSRPRKVDMATYAPASSLLYLESNSLTDIAQAINQTTLWKRVGPLVGSDTRSLSSWMVRFGYWTGIGPVETVVASRAQIAVVMIDLGTTEEGDTLKVRGETAVLIETHTSARRVKPAIERALKRLADSAYGSPTFSRINTNGTEYLIWKSPSVSRQIVATVDDSLVIVGNSEAALDACLAVRRGQRPNLQSNTELQRMRQQLSSERALSFGYVSSANTARLVAVATPLLLGRREPDPGIERIITNSAAKVVGAVGWSAFPFNNGIEDRYLFTLQQSVISRLRPAFAATTTSELPFQVLPDQVYSITQYRFQNPLDAWLGFKSAVLSQLDALSAIVFSGLLKSALVPYGIDDAEKFLSLAGPQLLTLRLRPNSERSVLIAGSRNEQALKEFINEKLGGSSRNQTYGRTEVLESKDGESAAAFVEGYLLMGPPADLKLCIDSLDQRNETAKSQLESLKALKPSQPATIVSYTNDSERVRSFVLALARARGKLASSQKEALEPVLSEPIYAVTESSLNTEGIERRTRSPFGQFSSIVALLFPSEG
jgi:hypothetical protein